MSIEPYRGELEQFDPYWLERMYAEWEEHEQYIEWEDDEFDGYDELLTCIVCGDCYTTNKDGVCGNCKRQAQIDEDA